MTLPKLRHVGIRVDSLERHVIDFYTNLLRVGVWEHGQAKIDGRIIPWVKMSDQNGVIFELFAHPEYEPHIAIEVDSIDESAYYYVTPEGHKVQFIRDPSNNLIELVEVKK